MSHNWGGPNLLSGGGEMGAFMRQYDWANSLLGYLATRRGVILTWALSGETPWL